MISGATQEILADIFENSERPDKMSIVIDESTKTVTVVYENMDGEWLKELLEE